MPSFPQLPFALTPLNPAPDWYSVTDAAALANVTPRTIALAISRGEISAFLSANNTGSTTLIPGHSIREWIADAPSRRAKQRVGRPRKSISSQQHNDDTSLESC
jgi:hypothetical protein